MSCITPAHSHANEPDATQSRCMATPMATRQRESLSRPSDAGTAKAHRQTNTSSKPNYSSKVETATRRLLLLLLRCNLGANQPGNETTHITRIQALSALASRRQTDMPGAWRCYMAVQYQHEYTLAGNQPQHACAAAAGCCEPCRAMQASIVTSSRYTCQNHCVPSPNQARFQSTRHKQAAHCVQTGDWFLMRQADMPIHAAPKQQLHAGASIRMRPKHKGATTTVDNAPPGKHKHNISFKIPNAGLGCCSLAA